MISVLIEKDDLLRPPKLSEVWEEILLNLYQNMLTMFVSFTLQGQEKMDKDVYTEHRWEWQI